MKKIYLASLIILLTLKVASAQQSGEVIVTEFMANPDTVFDSRGEWIELYNTTNADIDINGWTLRDTAHSSPNIHVITNGGPLMIASHSYFLMGRNDTTAVNGGLVLDYQYSPTWTLAQTNDEILLLNTNLDTVDLVAYTTSYHGQSWALHPDHMNAIDNDNFPVSWCWGTDVYDVTGNNRGTPKAANPACLTLGVNELVSEGAPDLWVSGNNLEVRFNQVFPGKHWSITDVTGKVIASGVTDKTDRLSVPVINLSHGIYTFKITETGYGKKFPIINER